MKKFGGDEEMKDELVNKLDNLFSSIKDNQKFFYRKPQFEPDEDGNIVIISKYSVGPIESICYGINKNGEYYFEWLYPEFWPGDEELEKDYRIIDEEEIIKAVKSELIVCREAGNNEMAKCCEDVLIKYGWHSEVANIWKNQ